MTETVPVSRTLSLEKLKTMDTTKTNSRTYYYTEQEYLHLCNMLQITFFNIKICDCEIYVLFEFLSRTDCYLI
jgi:hypothetical protein